MISIQKLVKITGVSSRMLRYYDEKGLLHPIYRSKSGVRYYDDTAIGAISLIMTFLSLDYRVEDIREVLSEETFSSESIRLMIQEQQAALLLQKEKINSRLMILQKLSDSNLDTLKSWTDVEGQIERIIYETEMKETHQDPKLLLQNSWDRQGSDFNTWIRFMFEPICFPKATMKMAEINASNGFYWLYNSDRLPNGTLDLFYDPTIRKGEESPQKEGLFTTWMDITTLTCVPDETYDLVFNDHPHFYRDHAKEGLLQMYRILKTGGCLFVVCEDVSHNELFSQWKDYIVPSRKYRNAYYKEHYTSNALIPLLKSIFGNISDFPRRNVVQISDESEIVNTLVNDLRLEKNDTASWLRFEHVKKEIQDLLKKNGYVERTSFYHVLKAEKST